MLMNVGTQRVCLKTTMSNSSSKLMQYFLVQKHLVMNVRELQKFMNAAKRKHPALLTQFKSN
jgi:hypothetical protein